MQIAWLSLLMDTAALPQFKSKTVRIAELPRFP